MSKVLENIKPRHGLNVRLTDRAGIWQCLDKSPKQGGWRMLAVDNEARESGTCAEATYRTMRPHNWDGADE